MSMSARSHLQPQVDVVAQRDTCDIVAETHERRRRLKLRLGLGVELVFTVAPFRRLIFMRLDHICGPIVVGLSQRERE